MLRTYPSCNHLRNPGSNGSFPVAVGPGPGWRAAAAASNFYVDRGIPIISIPPRPTEGRTEGPGERGERA